MSDHLALNLQGAGRKLQSSVCETLADFDSLECQWRDLERRIGDSLLPFQTFAWNRAWWTVFAKTTLARRDELKILCFHDDGRLVAVYPLFQTSIGPVGWKPMRYIRPFGADPNLTEIRIPLAVPEYLPAVLARALDFLKASAAAVVVLHLIGPLNRVLSATEGHENLQADRTRVLSNYVLPLAGDWDSFRSGLKRNIKESLRRCYNSLAREGHGYDLLVYDDATEIKARLPIFYRLHAQRAAAESLSVRHPDYFASPYHRAFMESVIDRMSATSTSGAHLFCLRIDNEIVAMRIGFRCGSSMYFYYSGYNPDYARFSVMTTLLAEAFRWCITAGVANANLSVGTDVSKTRWGPKVETYLETHLVRGNMAGLLAERLVRIARRPRWNVLRHPFTRNAESSTQSK